MPGTVLGTGSTGGNKKTEIPILLELSFISEDVLFPFFETENQITLETVEETEGGIRSAVDKSQDWKK